MSVSLTMEDVLITVRIQLGVIIVNVLLGMFFNLINMTVLKVSCSIIRCTNKAGYLPAHGWMKEATREIS